MTKQFLPLLLLVLFSCGTQTPKATEEVSQLFDSEIHQAFLENLASLCGESFAGKQVYRSHHGESWAHRKMIMHVSVCDDGRVYIPFHIDEDHSRTWMFVAEEGKLRFMHQHLHKDGTHEDGSMYGGYANNDGSPFMQYFPADDYSGQVIEGGAGNVWTVSLDENLDWFSYRLDRDGEKRFEIIFDLTKPVSPE